jgi:hypothetical protein
MPHVAIGRALALVCACAAIGAGAQTMYKWVDEKGVTHFSEQPPADAKSEKKATKVTPKVTPPSGGGAYDPNAWKSKEADAKKRAVDRGQQEQAEARGAAKRAEQCDRARARLAFLKDVHVLYRTNPDGTRTYLEDKQRDAEVAQAQQAVNENCR